jgi:hypothetical protein
MIEERKRIQRKDAKAQRRKEEGKCFFFFASLGLCAFAFFSPVFVP